MYWLIEPHSDDVFLSMHQHIVTLWKDIPKTIVTIFATPKRTLETAEYAKAVNCKHISLELQESGGLSRAAGKVPSFEEWKLPYNQGDVFIFPVGLQHPDHLAVISRIPPNLKTVWRYLDTPYYSKQKLAEEILTKTSGALLKSVLYASTRKWNHIKHFKSQAKFFHFNPPEALPRLEIILRCLQ